MSKAFCYYEHVGRPASCPQGGRLQCTICAFHESRLDESEKAGFSVSAELCRAEAQLAAARDAWHRFLDAPSGVSRYAAERDLHEALRVPEPCEHEIIEVSPGDRYCIRCEYRP